MSTLIAKNVQIGADTTATNNFTIYQPATPNGTLLIGNGNTGITSSLVALTSAGNVGLGVTPNQKLSLTVTNTTNAVSPLITGQTGTTTLSAINHVTQDSTNGVHALSFSTFNGGGGLTSKMLLDGPGNLGLGVTPSASTSNYRTLQIGGAASYGIFGQRLLGNAENFMGWNAYGGNNTTTVGTGFYYKNSGDGATMYSQTNFHSWWVAPSGTAGNAITFTQAMTLTAGGSLGLGETSPDTKLVVNNGSSALTVNALFTRGASDSSFRAGFANGSGISVNTEQAAVGMWYGTGFTNPLCHIGFLRGGGADGGGLTFNVGNTERARIDSSGNWTVGSNGGTNRALVANPQYTESVGWNGAVTSVWIGKNNSSNRSISAAGTLNASGADYAEYMTKAGEFTIVKGGVVGINADGKLTNVFADAVSFCVKSTDPSYVGGDSWGVGFEDDAEGLEAARQRVDRIAFAGQVPVNVTGATAGQYIVPIDDSGLIKGVAVNEADMTLSQYMRSVGKVIAIETDGRARIIVKVA